MILSSYTTPDHIKRVRHDLDISQETLSKLSGINSNTISRIELRKTIPNILTLEKIFSALLKEAEKQGYDHECMEMRFYRDRFSDFLKV